MTTHLETRADARTAGGVLPRLLGLLLAAWVPAALLGLWAPGAGAVAALVGLVGITFWAAATGRLAGLRALPLTDLGLLGVLLVACAPLVPARLGPQVVGVGFDDLTVLAGTVVAAVDVVRRDGWRGLVQPLALPLHLFAAWNLVAAAVAGSLTAAGLARGVARWELVALAFSAALTVARRPGRPRVLLGALLVVGLFEALFGLWAYAANWTAFSPARATLIGLERFRWYEPLYGRVPGRVTGTLGVSSNFFGPLMLAPIFIGATFFSRARDRTRRFVYAAAVGACLFGLVLAYTRASILALLVGFVPFLLIARSVRITALLCGLFLAAALTTPALDRFWEGNDRLFLAETSFQVIGQRPVSGVGPGSYEEGLTPAEQKGRIATPHNSFLLAAAETGIPGGLLLLASAVLPGAYLVLALRRRRDVMVAGVAAALLGFGLQAFSNNLFHIPGVAMSYWVAAAAAVGIVWGWRERPDSS